MQWSSANWNAILSSKLVCSLPLMGTLTANVCGGWFFLGQCLTSMIICFWTRRLACTTHGGSHKRIWPLLTHSFLFLSSLSLSMHCFLHTSGLLRKTIFFGHPYIFFFLMDSDQSLPPDPMLLGSAATYTIAAYFQNNAFALTHSQSCPSTLLLYVHWANLYLTVFHSTSKMCLF